LNKGNTLKIAASTGVKGMLVLTFTVATWMAGKFYRMGLLMKVKNNLLEIMKTAEV
jgi:hypothetical protein